MAGLGILLSAAIALAPPSDTAEPPGDAEVGVNLGGGGLADNECECGAVGRPRASSPMTLGGMLALGLVLVARRRRIV